MKKSVVVAGLCIAGAAFSLQADTTLEGPSLGYVSTKSGVRNVLGMVGAARLSGAVAQELTPRAVAPGSIVVGVKPTGELVRRELRDGSETDLGVSGATTIAASPAGEIFLAIAGDHAHWLSKLGARIVDRSLPGAPILLTVADQGSAAAMTVTEADGEALYLINDQGTHRVLHAARFAAIAFLPHSGDFVVADDSGSIQRVGNDLRFTPLTTLRGVRALAGTADGTRLIAVAEHTVVSLRFATQETNAVDCSCTGAVARPLSASIFLITDTDASPMWMVDASREELRLAFIPEAVDE